MNETGLLGLFCGAASLSGLALSINFFLNKRQKSLSHVFLGVLFLAVSVRLSKSIWYFILYDVAEWGLIAGFLALSIMGPALLLYIKQSQNRGLTVVDLLHLLIPVAGLVLKVTDDTMSYRILYMSATGIIGLYMAYAAFKHFAHAYESATLRKYNGLILLSTTLIWLAFVSQHYTGTMLSYAYGSAFASLVIYGLSINKMTKSLALQDAIKSGFILPEDTLNTIKAAFEEKKVYLRSGVTLNQFSEEFGIPTYLVTKSVNRIYGKSFPETVNSFRIKEVKEHLENNRNKLYKIEGIAFEAGFSTPSSFYAAFKKETGMTPTSYQKQFNLDRTKVA